MNKKKKTRKILALSLETKPKVSLLNRKKDITSNQSIEKREIQSQQAFFEKRKKKELKAEKHQQKLINDKREKIMKKLNNQAKQEALKQEAIAKGLFTPTEIDKELMQAFKYNKVNWKKFFLIYFTNKKHSLEKVKVKGLYEFRFKKEEYLKKKPDYMIWLKKRLKNDFIKIIKRFNYTMARYVKKYNDERFKNYKIEI